MTGGGSSDYFRRAELLVGNRGMSLLASSRVVIFGVGGVGSFAAEALARAGIGHLTLVDRDRVEASNINRQLHATSETVGQAKAEVMAARVRTINPHADVVAAVEVLTAQSVAAWVSRPWTYVVDAIDEGEVKLVLLAACVNGGLPTVSSMGAARRLAAGAVRVADIANTRNCPLARRIRRGLLKLGIHSGIQVVFSEEMPILAAGDGQLSVGEAEAAGGRRPQGTMSYMPALFGLHCAAVVITGILASLPVRRLGDHGVRPLR